MKEVGEVEGGGYFKAVINQLLSAAVAVTTAVREIRPILEIN